MHHPPPMPALSELYQDELDEARPPVDLRTATD